MIAYLIWVSYLQNHADNLEIVFFYLVDILNDLERGKMWNFELFRNNVML